MADHHTSPTPLSSPQPPPLPSSSTRLPRLASAALREPQRDATPSNATGFVARLGGVSLADLIRFECMRRSRCVLRVSSRGQAGYLYFRDGALVHAATAIATGAEAVAELLAWRSGSVESGVGPWPSHESITMPWEDLLREKTGMDIPATDAAGADHPPVAAAKDPRASTRAQTVIDRERVRRPLRERRPAGDGTVVMAPSGRLIQGGLTNGLPEAASYAAHMAEMIGGFLGFDRFCALEANYGSEQLLVGRNPDGNLVARREKNPADLEDLRHAIIASEAQ